MDEDFVGIVLPKRLLLSCCRALHHELYRYDAEHERNGSNEVPFDAGIVSEGINVHSCISLGSQWTYLGRSDTDQRSRR